MPLTEEMPTGQRETALGDMIHNDVREKGYPAVCEYHSGEGQNGKSPIIPERL